jgi:GNAT superfamily N-acetyltransferase
MTANGSIDIRCLEGREINDYIDDLARLRIEIFKGFPYLYEGDLDYERRYLAHYLDSKDSVLVVALDGSHVVGVSTGMPMVDADEAFQRPFIELGYDIERVFYFAESVLDESCRGQGIGVRFFDEREAHVQRLGRFDWMCFAAIVRSPDHPMQPADYRLLHDFWRKRGYERRPEMRATFRWKEVGSTEENQHVMEYWIKPVSESS